MKKPLRPVRPVRPLVAPLLSVRGGADFDGLNAKADVLVIGRG